MKERQKLNFITYIFMMYQSGLMALGKIENPATKKIFVELEEAKGIIELLEILEEKTKGNLSSEEQKTLNMVLDTLRFNYIEIAEKHTDEKSVKLNLESNSKDEENIEIH